MYRCIYDSTDRLIWKCKTTLHAFQPTAKELCPLGNSYLSPISTTSFIEHVLSDIPQLITQMMIHLSIAHVAKAGVWLCTHQDVRNALAEPSVRWAEVKTLEPSQQAIFDCSLWNLSHNDCATVAAQQLADGSLLTIRDNRPSWPLSLLLFPAKPTKGYWIVSDWGKVRTRRLRNLHFGWYQHGIRSPSC